MPDVTQPVRATVRVWIQAQPICDIPLRGQRRRPTQGHSCFPSQPCPLPQAEFCPLIPGRQWGPNQRGLIGPSSPGLGWKSTPTAPAIQMSPYSFNLEQNPAARFSYPAPTHVSDAGVLWGTNPSLTPGEPSENSESLTDCPEGAVWAPYQLGGASGRRAPGWFRSQAPGGPG